MSGHQELTYAVDFRAGRQGPQENKFSSSHLQALEGGGCSPSIPRIARLMALAIRFEGLLRKEALRDYAELARLGGVTRARITKIMKLLDLAPDIQEQLLFLPDQRTDREKPAAHSKQDRLAQAASPLSEHV